ADPRLPCRHTPPRPAATLTASPDTIGSTAPTSRAAATGAARASGRCSWGGGAGRRDTIQLAPTHWARGLQAPVAFPYQRPVEASAMGGGVWQDNTDGTYTQLDDDYYVPATGWSYLDLYLMGLIAPAEMPDFFILRHLVPAGRGA